MQQEKGKVVFDTNIVVSAAISMDGAPAKVFEKFLAREIVNYTTDEIIEEVEDVFERPSIKESVGEELKKFIISAFKDNSVIIKPTYNESAVAKDKDDDKFINCALTANAIIISGDSHLLELKEFKWVKILSANEFLRQQ